MVVEITKMSKNGQIVIPSGVRKAANITPSTQFLVLTERNNLILKRIDEKEIIEDIALAKKIERSEREFKEGKGIELDSEMSVEEMDKILMGA